MLRLWSLPGAAIIIATQTAQRHLLKRTIHTKCTIMQEFKAMGVYESYVLKTASILLL